MEQKNLPIEKTVMGMLKIENVEVEQAKNFSFWLCRNHHISALGHFDKLNDLWDLNLLPPSLFQSTVLHKKMEQKAAPFFYFLIIFFAKLGN